MRRYDYKTAGRPKLSSSMINREGSGKGLRNGWIRSTFILKEETAGLLRDYAFTEGKPLKEVTETLLNEILTNKIEKRERTYKRLSEFYYSIEKVAELTKMHPIDVRKYFPIKTISQVDLIKKEDVTKYFAELEAEKED